MINNKAEATVYYFDSNVDVAGDGSIGMPFKDISKISKLRLNPQDEILFKADSKFIGNFDIKTESDNKRKTLKIGTYGEGEKPHFEDPKHINVMRIHASNVIIDGLSFGTTRRLSSMDETNYQSSGSVLILENANNVKVINSTFNESRIGIKSYGEHTEVSGSEFRDLQIGYVDKNQSYGAIGISVNNSFAKIKRNVFVNARSDESPYGADGGAIEIEGYRFEKNGIEISHNISVGGVGFIEVTESKTSDVLVAYNISDDYQQFISFDTTTLPKNYRVINNTIIRNRESNQTDIFSVLFYRDEGEIPDDSWLSIENNVIYAPTAKMLNGTYSYKTYDYPHRNNIVFDGTQDPIGFPLGNGDLNADPLILYSQEGEFSMHTRSPANAYCDNILKYELDVNGSAINTKGKISCGAIESRVESLENANVFFNGSFDEYVNNEKGRGWYLGGSGTVRYEVDDNNNSIVRLSATSKNQITDIRQMVWLDKGLHVFNLAINSVSDINEEVKVEFNDPRSGTIVKALNLSLKDNENTPYSEIEIGDSGFYEVSIGLKANKNDSWILLDQVRLRKK